MTVVKRYTVPGPDGGLKRMRYVSRVEWRNLRLFWAWRIVREFGLCTPWGNLIFGRWLPFEYRYGDKKPLLTVGRYHLRWVRLVTMEEDS
jgi:hypothetical protein